MSRPAFRWELASATCIPLSLACVEPGLIGVLASRVFGAGGLVIAALAAAPHLGFLSTFFTTRWIRGRERVRIVNAMQLALIACVVAIALIPVSTLGVALLIAFVIGARCCLAGILTARSDIWGSNFPRNVRGRATGRLTVVAGLAMAAFGLTLGWAMDTFQSEAQWVYRVVFAFAAAMGLVGVYLFSRVRWRHRAVIMKKEREGAQGPALHTARQMLAVLRDDPTYRRFMAAQFFMGVPNLAAIAPFVLAINEVLKVNNTYAFALTEAIPLITMLVATPLWARLLDRTDIVRFRVIHSWSFVFSSALTAAGLLMQSLLIVVLARTLLGAAFAGGKLAWSLGHHDFAPRHMASLYMGIHVTLTGMRGVTAPFIGALLYTGWSFEVFGERWQFVGMGGWVFALFAFMSMIGAVMFARLRRDIVKGKLTMRGRDTH